MNNLFITQLILLIAISNAATIFDAFSSSIGSIFTQLEEAPFKLVSKSYGYEEREYPPLNWVCSDETDIKKGEARQQSIFMDLYNYVQGENDLGVTMKMSIPVSIEFKRNVMPFSTVSACFFIGGPYQKKPPNPKNRSLRIVKRNKMIVYTRKFGGFISVPSKWENEATKLSILLVEDGKNIQSDIIYWNAFDSPLKFWNRRNEVWILKKE